MLDIEAAGELAEAMDDLATKQDLQNELKSLEARIVNRLLIAMIGTAAVIIGAVALIQTLA